jgi:hypothetical protein
LQFVLGAVERAAARGGTRGCGRKRARSRPRKHARPLSRGEQGDAPRWSRARPPPPPSRAAPPPRRSRPPPSRPAERGTAERHAGRPVAAASERPAARAPRRVEVARRRPLARAARPGSARLRDGPALSAAARDQQDLHIARGEAGAAVADGDAPAARQRAGVPRFAARGRGSWEPRARSRRAGGAPRARAPAPARRTRAGRSQATHPAISLAPSSA